MKGPGIYISAIGHIGLIGWLILGWGFDADPLPIDPIPFTTISGDAFADMMAARTPKPADAEPTALPQPVVDDTPPPPPAQVATPTPAPTPDPVAPPVAENPPPPPPPPLVTEATDVPPVAPAPPPAPPPSPQLEVSQRPTPRQADRIAATPSAPAPPDAQVADVVQQETVPDAAADPEVVLDATQATAPPETTTEIVTEAEKPSGAVETSVRPQSRPSRPTPPVSTPPQETPPQETPPQETPPTPADPPAVVAQDDIDNLLAELSDDTPSQTPTAAPAVPAGPPMTGAENDGFRVSVQSCWNVGGMSSAAQQVTITVAFDLTTDRKVDGDVRQVSASGGDAQAIAVAFRTARSAIFQCQNRGAGFTLPSDKYEQWREVELTFDPSGMRLR